MAEPPSPPPPPNHKSAYNQLVDVMLDKERIHRSAIRWLLECVRFRNIFEPDEWKDGDEGRLSAISVVTTEEAMAAVISSRAALESAREALENHKRENHHGNIQGQQ